MEKIIQGDCLDVLKEIPDNSVDAVVTDPPYGLSKEPDIYEVLTKWLAGEDYHHRGGGFLGKTWDSFVPGPSIWKEVYRVLKPGGHALVFAGTRTQDLMTISLRLAGFEIRDVIEWLFFSGFPKSLDVSKAFDRRKHGYLIMEEFKNYLNQKRKEKGLSLKQINEYLGTATNGGGVASAIMGDKDTTTFPAKHQYEKLKKLLDLDGRFDEIIEEAEREKIGEGRSGKTYGMGGIRGVITSTGEYDITAPATELAKKWDGWKAGTLKPAHEPIIMARKPLEKNVAYNVEKWGTGAINVDGCRIGDEIIKTCAKEKGESFGESFGRRFNGCPESYHKGRFPANCVTLEEDAFFSKYFNITPPELSKKTSKKDRNSDWKGEEISLPEKQGGGMQGTLDKSLKTGSGNERKAMYRNNHPTVKPTALMAWLIRLVTPPGGIVLDPFAGSGSTLVAAKREGFSFIGIELEPEYYEIAKARIGA